MKSQEILPVLFSIVVIILVAILEKQSRLVAALTATMPLTAALALWIVYASSSGEQSSVTQFSLSMVLGFLPTLAFMIAVWLSARAGMKLIPMLLTGYGVWAAGAGALILLRNLIGLG
jgi:hypothetical protein